MSLIMGIVGLPNVGKSSLFNALTKQNALVENRPFATINPNLGVVDYVDERVVKLAEMVKPEKVIYSSVKFLDIAGLVKGASEGEGLGNKFLENIRTVDAICLVVRAFDDVDVFSVNSSVDPVFEAEIVLCELIYSDLDMVKNIMKKLKSNDSALKLMQKIQDHLMQNKLINSFEFTPKELEILKPYSFLTRKSIILLANTDNKDSSRGYLEKSREYADKIGAKFLSLNIKLENEIGSLSDEDQREFLQSMGIEGSCLNRFISVAMETLNLRSFFTVGKKEVRSWVFKNGYTAPECAGVIHSDMHRGFIKAEIVKYVDYIEFGDMKLLKQNGKVRLEGSDYLMEDGDIVNFKFNV